MILGVAIAEAAHTEHRIALDAAASSVASLFAVVTLAAFVVIWWRRLHRGTIGGLFLLVLVAALAFHRAR